MWSRPKRFNYRRWLLMSMQFTSVLAIFWLLIAGPVHGAVSVISSVTLRAHTL